MSENVEELEYELDEGLDVYGAAAEEEFEEEDQFSLLGSSDDAEQQRMYMEYLALIKDIDCQNKMVADIKAQLSQLCSKECKTRCEIKSIKRLHHCMEQENLKLQCLIKKAVGLQNFGSKRHYRPIPVETTCDEDNLSPYVGAIPPAVWKSSADSSSDPCDPCTPSDPCADTISEPCSTQPSEGEISQETLMCQVIKALKKMKVCCPEDKKLIKQIAAVMSKKKPTKPKKRPCDPCIPCDPCNPCSSGGRTKKAMTGDFIAPNLPCEHDSIDILRKKVCCIQAVMCKLKEQIAAKECELSCTNPMAKYDAALDRLRKRLKCVKTEIPRIKREIACKEREIACGAPPDCCLDKLKKQLCSMTSAVRRIKDEISCREIQRERESKLPRQSASLEKLREKICRMQAVMIGINNEIAQREDEGEDVCLKVQEDNTRDPCEPCMQPCEDSDMDPIIVCKSSKNTKSEQLRKLKENYLHLLSEFAKKDCKLKELEQRLKGFCGSFGGGSGKKGVSEVSEAELDLLRCRINELREEQDEFKCIMKEQAQQLEDYRQKYLTAQQKVEEQNAALEKLNMNNKRIEKQINNEVKEIRSKFQEKLNELLQYPKLLENEQCKYSQAIKERDELQAKLGIICKELRNLKAKQEEDKVEDCRPELTKCRIEYEQRKCEMEELQRQRDLLCEELQKVKDDLDTLRCESAKIIARTKERADQMKQHQQEQIDRLEKELAQCRATACLSVNDRECVIREMQGQLNTLSFSFDAAQKQIKTLRNHIAFVSNESCFPIKCNNNNTNSCCLLPCCCHK